MSSSGHDASVDTVAAIKSNHGSYNYDRDYDAIPDQAVRKPG